MRWVWPYGAMEAAPFTEMKVDNDFESDATSAVVLHSQTLAKMRVWLHETISLSLIPFVRLE